MEYSEIYKQIRRDVLCGSLCLATYIPGRAGSVVAAGIVRIRLGGGTGCLPFRLMTDRRLCIGSTFFIWCLALWTRLYLLFTIVLGIVTFCIFRWSIFHFRSVLVLNNCTLRTGCTVCIWTNCCIFCIWCWFLHSFFLVVGWAVRCIYCRWGRWLWTRRGIRRCVLFGSCSWLRVLRNQGRRTWSRLVCTGGSGWAWGRWLRGGGRGRRRGCGRCGIRRGIRSWGGWWLRRNCSCLIFTFVIIIIGEELDGFGRFFGEGGDLLGAKGKLLE